MQRGVLQQHDRLGVDDPSVRDHRQRLVDAELQHLDVLAFMRKAASSPRGDDGQGSLF